MSIQDGWQKVFSFLGSKPVVVEPSEEHLSSDAGLLPLRQFDEKLGLTAGFSAQLGDRRQRPSHAFLEMVRSRVFGILAGYEDQNDHDALRSDAVFKLVAGRLPDAADLASQPTLSRFENSITPRMLLQLEAWFIQQFVQSFAEIPAQLTLDADVYDDPTHGQQQLTFFHGFYEQYQYLVRVFTCPQNDHVILPVLLHGTARASLAVEPDLRRIVQALRAVRPDVRIHFRVDSGFAAPSVYDECETLGIEYTIGLPMNPVLQRESEACLQQAVAAFEQTGEPQRLFVALDYQAASWRMPRWVVVKCEVNAQGTNRRAIVTNRPGARVCLQGAYDDYAERGESENRNKELKRGLLADRLSDHRYMANCFRMFLHCLAHQILVRVRQTLPEPELPKLSEDLPREALAGYQRRRGFNQRRKADPLGEGHPCTWRLMLIKVAAWITVSARRVVVRLSGSWPYLDFYRQVSDAVRAFAPPPAPSTS